MTDVHTLEKNLSAESPRWHNPLSLPLNLRGRRWGLWTLALFFFLLPLQTRYFLREAPLYEWGTLSLYGIEIFGWVVIALYFIRAWKQRSIKTLRNVSLFPCFLVLLAFLSIIWAPDKLVAVQAAVRLLEGVLLYVVISTVAKRSGEISRDNTSMQGVRSLGSLWSLGMTNLWMWTFLAGATIQAALGIYQFLTQSSFASTLLGMALHDPRELGTSVVQFGAERWLRAYGGLPHPNVLGGYLVVALAICYKKLQEVTPHQSKLGTGQARSYRRLLVHAMMPVLATGIFFTFSRVAWVGAAAVIAWWIFEEMRRSRRDLLLTIVNNRSIGLVLVVGWMAALSVIYWPLVSARLNFKSTERLEVKARVERVEGVREAWEIIKRHPVRGVGIGNYTQSVARELRSNQPLWRYQPVHSVPLLVWAELGTIGLILFVGVLWKVVTHIRERSLAPTVASGLGMTTLGLLLLLDHYLWTLPFGILLFWAILGLSTALKQEGLDKNPAL